MLKPPRLILATFLSSAALINAAPPHDFPHFTVSGHEKEMASLRELFWLHYPGAGPKSTLWDEWRPDASPWPAGPIDHHADNLRQQWHDVLRSRIIDSESHVPSHQHCTIAHQPAWPFPFSFQRR